MKFSESILYFLSYKNVEKQVEKIKRKGKKSDRGIKYAQWQYEKYLKRGIRFDIQDKVILEIGCGHGGNACFLAVNGSRKVYGLDINAYNLEIANKFKKNIETKLGNVNVEFINQNVHDLKFEDGFFDLIIADNVFEHFDDNVSVMKECKRVLKKEGKIIIPSFPSIYSKHGAHLKKGIAVPWVYTFFKEKTIIKVLQRNSLKFPVLMDVYGGLKDNPKTIKEVRQYKDLNYITNKKFKNQATKAGLKIVQFNVAYLNTPVRWFAKLIFNKYSIIHDLLSTKSTATLEKQ